MSIPPLPNLSGADWLTSRHTQAVFAALAAAGQEARAVGGCVRNGLMGLPVADIDIATTALPAETIAAAEAAGMAAIPTGVDHGTITVVTEGRPFEVTTLRRDVATDGRRAVVAYSHDWAEDAARRDFTMNALYCGADGTVFDPLGGYVDLQARRVRFIGSPEQRIREDYLRILRFFRFHAQYGVGDLDKPGALACVRLRDGLAQLSAERVGAEIMKLLAAPFAVAAIAEMFDLGLLVDVLAAAPRLHRFARLVDLDTAPDAALRLAALAVHAPDDAERLAARLRLSGDQRAVLALAGPCFSADTKEHDARAALYRLGSEDYRRRLLLDWASSDTPLTDADWLRLLSLPDRAPIPPFPIAGRDLVALGLSPGPKVGDLLRSLEGTWTDADFSLDRDALLNVARQLIVETK
jgi:poly(A) polymerase